MIRLCLISLWKVSDTQGGCRVFVRDVNITVEKDIYHSNMKLLVVSAQLLQSSIPLCLQLPQLGLTSSTSCQLTVSLDPSYRPPPPISSITWLAELDSVVTAVCAATLGHRLTSLNTTFFSCKNDHNDDAGSLMMILESWLECHWCDVVTGLCLEEHWWLVRMNQLMVSSPPLSPLLRPQYTTRHWLWSLHCRVTLIQVFTGGDDDDDVSVDTDDDDKVVPLNLLTSHEHSSVLSLARLDRY